MPYRENIQELCTKSNIANPIEEDDLEVEGLSFLVDEQWMYIPGTNMNRAGRLFFQVYTRKFDESKVTVYTILEQSLVLRSMDEMKNLGRITFSENWEDAEKVGRKLLTAFKSAEAITVHWK